MNKIFLSVALLLVSSFSFSALAKTEGSYAGVDLLQSTTSFKESYSYELGSGNSTKYSDSNYGLGLNYKYAINFQNAFIAPGVILEHNGGKAKGVLTDQLMGLKVGNRYGVKADIGYDVTDRIAPYLTAGYATVSYSTKNFNGAEAKSKSGNSANFFYGAGLKIDCNENLAFNLEYNTQKFSAKSDVPNNDIGYKTHFKSKLDILKVGIAYKF